MNRIILIGNGFDLAHGLKTSYKNFIDDYWLGFIKQAKSGNKRNHSDDYMNFSTNVQTLAHVLSSVNTPSSYNELLSQIQSFRTYQVLGRDAKINLTFTNQFMERILKKSGLQKWVDIENEYYENIKEISRSNFTGYEACSIQRGCIFSRIQAVFQNRKVCCGNQATSRKAGQIRIDY